jgi:L-threonylcarbamoyladenylate synthase
MEKLTEKDVKIAARILRNGEILVFPTETVYGIGVVYDSKIAFENLVAVKKRPPSKPFSLMCSSLEQAFAYVDVGTKARKVMEEFLPGELTVLVHARNDLPEHVTLGTGIIGIRVPDSPYVQSLISGVGKPCLVTSANISGQPTSTNYEEVSKIFDGLVGGIVEGKCTSLIASTIVDLTSEEDIKLIREGPIPFAKLQEAWRNAK